MLAQIEKGEGVKAAWIDFAGKRIAIERRAGVDVMALFQRIGIKGELLPDGMEEGESWYRPHETIELSAREAKALAEEYTTKATAAAKLTEDQARKLKELIERHLFEQFKAYHEGKARPDGFIDIEKEIIFKEAAEFLTSEQVQALRKAMGS